MLILKKEVTIRSLSLECFAPWPPGQGALFSFDIRLIPVLVNVVPSSTRPRVNNAPFGIGTRAWGKHMMIDGIMPGTRI